MTPPSHPAFEAPAPTEVVDASLQDLDRRSVEEILAAIHAGDRCAVAAVGAVQREVADAVNRLVACLAAGGRWFNVGAGTSGRLGCLDAAEIPPTFGMEPGRVEGLIAGGRSALWRAIEGAEDDADAAHALLRQRGLGPRDAVLAISASGRTPFALGAVSAARVAGARSLALTCDPASPLARAAELTLAPQVGPEVIAGSTRMKGGLAQKMILHQLSTAVMIRLGRVQGNRMTHLRPASRKLRERALRMVAELGGIDATRAGALLDAHAGVVADAVRAARDLQKPGHGSSSGNGPA